ncbi:MAG: transposase [Candidatus Shapirobacteria bacterium]|nr:transposase [Candidatus Shapirobacteria bacterium]
MDYHRRSIRLDGFDYSNNRYYFVTVCCQNREKIFGEIGVGAGLVPALMENKMILNDVGIMVKKIILEYFNKNKLIFLDEFIIMSDHIHMIVVIKNKFINNDVNDEINTRAGTRPAPTLGMIMGEFKSIITNEYIKNIKENNWPRFNKRLWQRNYYERIIRNEKEYLMIKKYIKDNPINKK